MLATDYSTAESRPSRRVREPASVDQPDAFAGSLPPGATRTVAAKDHVFCEGDVATHVYRVELGHVCIYRMLPDGRRQVIDFAYPGDLIGLGDVGEHTASAQATNLTRLSCYPITVVWEQARRDVGHGLKLYQAMANELAAARDLLVTVSQRSACERVASFLLALSRRNLRRGGNPDEIVLPMTRADIADFLGLTIETVSRTFTKFRLAGLIDLEQCILVTIRDPKGLTRIAAGKPDLGHSLAS
ncbi:MAG: hypothetical protein RL291_576 [Pseudomonadota bacterium]|jgi:CRP/FNR family transcriptional regulator